jgi:hypothetical protein
VTDKTGTPRRGLVKLAGAGVVGTAATLVAGQTTANAAPPFPFPSMDGPLIGSWQVQVTFLKGPQAGKIEQTLVTFTSGGGIVESDATGTWAHAGAWKCLGHNAYQYVLVEFSYDSTTQAVTQIVVPNIHFALSADLKRLTSTSTVTDVYIYDPATGVQVTTIHLPGVSSVIGSKIGTDYVPPRRFPV